MWEEGYGETERITHPARLSVVTLYREMAWRLYQPGGAFGMKGIGSGRILSSMAGAEQASMIVKKDKRV